MNKNCQNEWVRQGRPLEPDPDPVPEPDPPPPPPKTAALAVFVAFCLLLGGVSLAQGLVRARLALGLASITADPVWSASHPNDPVAITWPSAGATTTVASASAADTAAGTGARTGSVTCALDSADGYGVAVEVFSFNGASNVTLATECRTILDAKVLTAGSGGTNAGIVQVKHGATVLAEIAAGAGEAETSVHTISRPGGACLRSASASISSRGGEFTVWAREPGGVFVSALPLVADRSLNVEIPGGEICWPLGTDVYVGLNAPAGTIVGEAAAILSIN